MDTKKILRSIVSDPASVKHHKGWGNYIEVPFESIHKIGLIEKEDSVELSLLYGDTQSQSKAFYSADPKTDQIKYSDWRLSPHFHLSNVFGKNLVWINSKSTNHDYIAFWKKHPQLLRRHQIEELQQLIDFLSERKVIDSGSQETIEREIFQKNYTGINICAGFGAIYSIKKTEFNALDEAGILSQFLIDKINEGLSIIGQNGNHFLLDRTQVAEMESDTAEELRKDFPIKTTHFLSAVEESSKRSRQMLLYLIFTLSLILMAFVNSLNIKYNWFSLRQNEARIAIKYIDFSEKTDGLGSVACFIEENELLYPAAERISKKSNDSIFGKFNENKFPPFIRLKKPSLYPVHGDVPERMKQYNTLANALSRLIVAKNISDRDELLNYLKEMDESQIEHVQMVRVPILGISFDVNYLGIYSGIILFILLYVMFAAFLRECINTEIAFTKCWNHSLKCKRHHHVFYEYFSMMQVINMPRKLFVSRGKILFWLPRPRFTNNNFSFVVIFFTIILYATLFYYDLEHREYADPLDKSLVDISLYIEGFLMLCIAYYGILSITVTSNKARIWNNQVTEFNFEFIRENIKDDINNDDLKDYAHLSKLSVADRQYVKNLWYEYISMKPYWMLSDHRFIIRFFRNRDLWIFRRFINSAQDKLTGRTRKKTYTPDQYMQINECWGKLKDWHNKSGQRNITDKFKISFHEMCNDIRENTLKMG